MYFYDLELEATNSNLRNKISELQNLVYQYSSELALCNGDQDGFVLGGSMGIKLVKPKNLIYAQALLNINLAWYIYLYNTKKIEYEKCWNEDMKLQPTILGLKQRVIFILVARMRL